ncbi:hypothetical protein B0H10DRAFT_2438291 [Mycena sp. CBHHK59/15]|nr:hypothetical protein B0H10DRAFT_2438291 [Mycena sp. CBHHK59/15]
MNLISYSSPPQPRYTVATIVAPVVAASSAISARHHSTPPSLPRNTSCATNTTRATAPYLYHPFPIRYPPSYHATRLFVAACRCPPSAPRRSVLPRRSFDSHHHHRPPSPHQQRTLLTLIHHLCPKTKPRHAHPSKLPRRLGATTSSHPSCFRPHLPPTHQNLRHTIHCALADARLPRPHRATALAAAGQKSTFLEARSCTPRRSTTFYSAHPPPASSAALTHPPSSDTTLYSPAARAAAPRRLLRCPSPTHRAPARHLLRMPRATSHATASAACCANEASTASPHWPLPAAHHRAPRPLTASLLHHALSAISFDRPPISSQRTTSIVTGLHCTRRPSLLSAPPSSPLNTARIVGAIPPAARSLCLLRSANYDARPRQLCLAPAPALPIADAAVPAALHPPKPAPIVDPAPCALSPACAAHPALDSRLLRPRIETRTDHAPRQSPSQEKRARPALSSRLRSPVQPVRHRSRRLLTPVADRYRNYRTPGPRARHVLRVHRNFQPQPAPPAPGDSRCKECALPCTLDPHSRPRVLLRYTTNLPLLGHHHPPPARAPTRIVLETFVPTYLGLHRLIPGVDALRAKVRNEGMILLKRKYIQWK